MVKVPQYVEEASYPTADTDPTNPAFQWIGMVDSYDPKADMAHLLQRQVGSEDLKQMVKGAEAYDISLAYKLQTSTFSKYAIQAAGGGVGTIDKSLFIYASARLGGPTGTENFIRANGCRINRYTLRARTGGPIEASAEIIARNIIFNTTLVTLGTGSLATDPATAPFMFYDGGANPVTFGTRTPDVREMEVTFNRNLERVHVLGLSKQKFLPPRFRSIEGRFTILWEDLNQYTDLTGDTAQTLTWVLKTATSTLTLTGCKYRKLDSLVLQPEALALERYSFTALSASIT